ncbi:hypothetical protein SDC9_123905 [bioreactor metagenome]|uniref:Uncharacterized protein n=1 Tax=bioreactor metagenome TaxID=1076179 RepID=A0A645CIX9_9ZZZZ|nr:hypothetical protein [Petrimonas sp.]
MDLQTRKIKFVQEFLGLEDEKLISRFERLIRKERKVSDSFTPMRVSDLHRRIDLSMTDSENGKLTGADDLLDEIKRW